MTDTLDEMILYCGYNVLNGEDGIKVISKRVRFNIYTVANDKDNNEYEYTSSIYSDEKTYVKVRNGLRHKVRKEGIYNLKRGIDIKKTFYHLLLAKGMEQTISITESMKAGNCEYGSLQFTRDNNIPLHGEGGGKYVRCIDIIKSPKRNQILKSYDFLKIIKIRLGEQQ